MNNNKDNKAPKYLNDVFLLAADLKPGIHHIEVKHEHDCALLNGKGECNCTPEVKMVRPS